MTGIKDMSVLASQTYKWTLLHHVLGIGSTGITGGRPIGTFGTDIVAW